MNIMEIALNFDLNGDIIDIRENDTGLINKTYIVITTSNKYIIQKINNAVFKDPISVMKNIRTVIEHLKNQNKTCEMLNLINTKAGNYYLVNNEDVYRCYNYLNDSIFYNKVKNYKQLYEMGKTIGEFHKELIDLDPSTLCNTIPNFHDSDLRYDNLVNAFKCSTVYKQQEVFSIYDCINNEIKEVTNLNKLINENQIPIRIAHNDTKINNIVFSKSTNKGKCLIDFDTIMPGTILFDYGDALRSVGSNVSEESFDFDNIDFSINNFIYFTSGYLSSIGDKLNNNELNYLFDSIYMITFECGMRFLTDYLDGDKYFFVKFPKHNLFRAINQLTLAKKIKNKKELINKIIKEMKKRVIIAK